MALVVVYALQMAMAFRGDYPHSRSFILFILFRLRLIVEIWRIKWSHPAAPKKNYKSALLLCNYH